MSSEKNCAEHVTQHNVLWCKDIVRFLSCFIIAPNHLLKGFNFCDYTNYFYFYHIRLYAQQYLQFTIGSVPNSLIIGYRLVRAFAPLESVTLAHKIDSSMKNLRRISPRHLSAAQISHRNETQQIALVVTDPKTLDPCPTSKASLLDNVSPVSETRHFHFSSRRICNVLHPSSAASPHSYSVELCSFSVLVYAHLSMY